MTGTVGAGARAASPLDVLDGAIIANVPVGADNYGRARRADVAFLSPGTRAVYRPGYYPGDAMPARAMSGQELSQGYYSPSEGVFYIGASLAGHTPGESGTLDSFLGTSKYKQIADPALIRASQTGRGTVGAGGVIDMLFGRSANAQSAETPVKTPVKVAGGVMDPLALREYKGQGNQIFWGDKVIPVNEVSMGIYKASKMPWQMFSSRGDPVAGMVSQEIARLVGGGLLMAEAMYRNPGGTEKAIVSGAPNVMLGGPNVIQTNQPGWQVSYNVDELMGKSDRGLGPLISDLDRRSKAYEKSLAVYNRSVEAANRAGGADQPTHNRLIAYKERLDVEAARLDLDYQRVRDDLSARPKEKMGVTGGEVASAGIDAFLFAGQAAMGGAETWAASPKMTVGDTALSLERMGLARSPGKAIARGVGRLDLRIPSRMGEPGSLHSFTLEAEKGAQYSGIMKPPARTPYLGDSGAYLYKYPVGRPSVAPRTDLDSFFRPQIGPEEGGSIMYEEGVPASKLRYQYVGRQPVDAYGPKGVRSMASDVNAVKEFTLYGNKADDVLEAINPAAVRELTTEESTMRITVLDEADRPISFETRGTVVPKENDVLGMVDEWRRTYTPLRIETKARVGELRPRGRARLQGRGINVFYEEGGSIGSLKPGTAREVTIEEAQLFAYPSSETQAAREAFEFKIKGYTAKSYSMGANLEELFRPSIEAARTRLPLEPGVVPSYDARNIAAGVLGGLVRPETRTTHKKNARTREDEGAADDLLVSSLVSNIFATPRLTPKVKPATSSLMDARSGPSRSINEAIAHSDNNVSDVIMNNMSDTLNAMGTDAITRSDVKTLQIQVLQNKLQRPGVLDEQAQETRPPLRPRLPPWMIPGFYESGGGVMGALQDGYDKNIHRNPLATADEAMDLLGFGGGTGNTGKRKKGRIGGGLL